MIVVSDIGEQWSPITAPAMQADIEIIISCGSVFWKAATTIGIRIPNVPHEVPVAKASPHPIRNMITGRKFIRLPAEFWISPATYVDAPRLSVMPFKLHANVRIRIGAIIAENPLGTHSIKSVKLIVLRII